MPESLFAPRRFRRSYLVYCTIAAFAVEGSIVGVAQIYRFNKTTDLPPIVTEIVNLEPTEEVQELILPKEDPIPTPEEPTPPPEETPPPEDTPPPDTEPEMTLDTPKPTPTPGPPKKPVVIRPTGTPFPANAKRGDVPQQGVVGGVPHATKTTGTPGGGWRIGAKPPYPYQARASHVTGSGSVKITTDATGHVVSATMSQSIGSSLLDSATVNFAKANWSGPPNASTVVPITYRMP